MVRLGGVGKGEEINSEKKGVSRLLPYFEVSKY